MHRTYLLRVIAIGEGGTGLLLLGFPLPPRCSLGSNKLRRKCFSSPVSPERRRWPSASPAGWRNDRPGPPSEGCSPVCSSMTSVRRGCLRLRDGSRGWSASYIGDDGTTVRGRAALEAAYAKVFAKKHNVKAEIDHRLASASSAATPPSRRATRKRRARARPRNRPPAATACCTSAKAASGSWPCSASGPTRACRCATSTGSSAPGKRRPTTPRCAPPTSGTRTRRSSRQITIKEADRTVTATQMHLKDPRTGGLRSWMFDDDGGFGEAPGRATASAG